MSVNEGLQHHIAIKVFVSKPIQSFEMIASKIGKCRLILPVSIVSLVPVVCIITYLVKPT